MRRLHHVATRVRHPLHEEETLVETITADALSALSRICPPRDPLPAVDVATDSDAVEPASAA